MAHPPIFGRHAHQRHVEAGQPAEIGDVLLLVGDGAVQPEGFDIANTHTFPLYLPIGLTLAAIACGSMVFFFFCNSFSPGGAKMTYKGVEIHGLRECNILKAPDRCVATIRRNRIRVKLPWRGSGRRGIMSAD